MPPATPSTAPASGVGDSVGSLAGRTIARLAKQVEQAIEPFELSLPQYRTLGVLAEGASMSSVLAERLAVKRPSVTSVIDGLVARGLVERRTDPSDRRRAPVVLTPLGLATVRDANRAVDQRLAAILGSLGDDVAEEDALAGLRTWHRALDVARDRRLAAGGGR